MARKNGFNYPPIFVAKNLFNPASKSKVIASLKNYPDYLYKCEVADAVHPSIEHHIYGKALPLDIGTLGTTSFIHESESFQEELNWSLLSFRKYKNELCQFVALQQQFEKNLLIGNHEKAEEFLDRIEKEICHSIWGIENRLLLNQLQGGLQKNKTYLTSVNEQTKNFILILADFFSKRAERELLISRYNQEVKTYLSKLSVVRNSQNIEYYYFKINYYDFEHFESLHFINSVEHKNSIIDRYLTFIKINQTKINQGIDGDEEHEVLKSRLSYVARKINDPLIENLRRYIDPNHPHIFSEIHKRSMEVFDYYTKGIYSEAIFLSRKFLKDFPHCLELYIIYCRSLITKGRDFEPITSSESMVNSIAQEVYSLIIKKHDPHITGLNLKKIAYQLSTFSISPQIISLVSLETSGDSKFFNLSLLNSKIANPLFHKIYGNRNKQKEFLQALHDYSPAESITIKGWQIILQENEDDLSKIEIEKERKLRFKAQIYQLRGEYEQAIRIYEPLLGNFKTPAHLLEEIIYNLFYCYLNHKDFNKCIKIYVDTYFSNPYLISRLNPAQVLKKIRQERFSGFDVGVDLPLFFFIAGAEEVRISTALENFLGTYNINRPSLLIPEIRDSGDHLKLIKINFLLDKVCTIDLFKHLVPIKTTKDKLNERLLIVGYLIDINHLHKQKEFIAERDEISRQIFIQEGLQEYDESKIFINEKMIKTNLLKDLEIEFDRYLSYRKLMSKKVNILFLNTSTRSVQSVTYDGKSEDIDPKNRFSNDPLFDIVKAMFFEIRNFFINSQFGLGEYLSARIRHGVFKSEIRPKFEKLRLITERNSKTKTYKENLYWIDKLNFLDENLLNLINDRLADFSKTLDLLIEEEALKKYLQIKTEDNNKEGWFDYSFDDDLFSYYYSLLLLRHKSFNEFADEIFNILWERTDQNLAEIRNKFTSDFKYQFEEAISVLERELLKLLDKSLCHELFENIATSKVNIQNDMDRISRWFNRIGKQTKEFQINRIVELSLEHINKRYDKKEIQLTKEIECPSLIRGDLSPSFIDLMCGFFDNTLKYCGIEHGKIETSLKISTINNLINLNITNSLYGDIQNIVEEFESFKIDLAQSSSEGRSGLKKAKRTITSDLGDNKNTLTFWIDQEVKSFNIECSINLERIKYEGVNN